MVSGRPQIRDRSSSWNTTSFSSLVRWTSSSIPYPWEIAARKEGMEFSGIPFSMGEHRVKKWTDLSFPRQSRPDQIKVK